MSHLLQADWPEDFTFINSRRGAISSFQNSYHSSSVLVGQTKDLTLCCLFSSQKEVNRLKHFCPSTLEQNPDILRDTRLSSKYLHCLYQKTISSKKWPATLFNLKLTHVALSYLEMVVVAEGGLPESEHREEAIRWCTCSCRSEGSAQTAALRYSAFHELYLYMIFSN